MLADFEENRSKAGTPLHPRRGMSVHRARGENKPILMIRRNRVTRITHLICLLFLILYSAVAAQAENVYLYKVTLVQAAPGKLPELIDLYKTRASASSAIGDEAPLW